MADQVIQVIIKGTDDASPAFNSVNAHIDGLQDSFNMLDHAINLASEVMANFITDALYRLGRAIGDVASEMISSNAQFEQYETQFGVLLGSVEAAQERMADLAEFGATTPFDLPGVVEADRILQGFGLHAEDVVDMFGFSGEEIRRIAGDTAAGTGASFQEMALLIGRFSSGATGEALMRMAELGIGTRAQLTEMGIEFSKSGELLSPLPEAMEAVLTLMEGKYGGLMEAQSTTFEGMMSNLRDWVGQSLREVGKPVFDILKDKLSVLLEFLNSAEAQDALDSFARGLGDAAAIMADLLLPVVEDAIRELPAIIEQVGQLIGGIAGFIDLIVNRDFEGALGRLLGVDEDDPLVGKIFDTRDAIVEFGDSILDWIDQIADADDVVYALGAAITIALIPTLTTIATTIGPIVVLFAALVAAFALVRTAWEEDFQGIRTAVTGFWDETLKPAFETIRDWAEERLPPIIERFAAVWRDSLLPELQEIWQVVETRILPLFGTDTIDVLALVEGALNALADGLEFAADAFEMYGDHVSNAAEGLNNLIDFIERAVQWYNDFRLSLDALADTLSNRVQTAIETLTTIWETRFLPVITSVVNFINEHVLPVFAAIDRVTTALGDIAITVLAGVFENVLMPALMSVWEFFDQKILTVLDSTANRISGPLQGATEKLVEVWETRFMPVLTSIWDYLSENIIPVFEEVADVAETILGGAIEVLRKTFLDPLFESFKDVDNILDDIADAINTFAENLESLDEKLPDWATPGSPTPFELGLRGMHDAMQQLAQTSLPSLDMAFNGMGAGGGFGGAQTVTNENYNLHVNTNAPAESAIVDFDLMKFLAGR